MSTMRPIERWARAAQAAYDLQEGSLDALGDRCQAIGLRVSATVQRNGFAAYSARDDATQVIVVRGTQDPKEGLADVEAAHKPWWWPAQAPVCGNVHAGFAGVAYALRDILRWRDTALPHCVFIGHSLGAAVVTLLATIEPPDAVFTYGSPRVGDTTFAAAFNALGVSSVRVVHALDLVPHPPTPGLGYDHVGGLVQLSRSGDNGPAVPAPASDDAELLALFDGEALADHHIDSYVDCCAKYAAAIPT